MERFHVTSVSAVLEILGFEMFGFEMFGLEMFGFEILGFDMFGLEILGFATTAFEILGLEILGFEMLGFEMLGLDMLGFEILGLEMFGVYTSALEILGFEMFGLETSEFRVTLPCKPFGTVPALGATISTALTGNVAWGSEDVTNTDLEVLDRAGICTSSEARGSGSPVTGNCRNDAFPPTGCWEIVSR